MLEPIGTVLAILGENIILIESSAELQEGDVVIVFGRVLADAVKLPKGTFPLESLDIPKGYLKVTLRQSGNYYTAERYRDTKERTRVIRKSNTFADALMTIGRGRGAIDEEVVEEVPGDWSAELDRTQSARLPVSRSIQVGDLVAKL